MIEANADVKLMGIISEVGTAGFKIAVKEFYTDSEWKRFVSPKEVEVAVDDYDNHLTSSELEFLLNAAKKAKTTASDDCEKQVIESIIKKLS